MHVSVKDLLMQTEVTAGVSHKRWGYFSGSHLMAKTQLYGSLRQSDCNLSSCLPAGLNWEMTVEGHSLYFMDYSNVDKPVEQRHSIKTALATG